MTIGKLEKVPLRDLWKHEERGFSTWLMENLDALGETIDIRLSEPQREVRAGSFEVDLVAEDEASNRVVIENQLESTDHDHLGKLLTYLTYLEAKTAVWITKMPRPEHVKAIAWLNETTPDDISFFLVKLEAFHIGGSNPAPLFTAIAGPSPEAKGFGQQRKELAERHILRLKFWDGLLKRAKEKGVMLHASRSPTKHSWIYAGSGRSGLVFVYKIRVDDNASAELYIDTGDKEENKKIFDILLSKRKDIERDFGSELLWERLNDKRASRIHYDIAMGGLNSGEDEWPAIQHTMIDAMARLHKALKPYIDSLDN